MAMAQGQTALSVLLEAHMDATSKVQQALESLRVVNGLLDAAARLPRQEKRHTRPR